MTESAVDELVQHLRGGRFAVAPDVLLTRKGPQRDFVLVVEDGVIRRTAPLSEYQGDASASLPARRLPGKAIIPGFVDAHTHLGCTFGKSLIGGEPAQIWKRIWGPMERALDPKASYVSAKWMFLESLRGGYTTVVNYSLNDQAKNDAVHKAAKEVGIRLVSATGLDEFSVDADGRERRVALNAILDRAEEHVAHCAGADLIKPSICCSSFLGNSPEIIAALAGFCAKRGVLFQMHSNEHFMEVHDCTVKFGKRPIKLFADISALGRTLLLHHVTLPAEEEIELLRMSHTGVTYNPVAAVWKGNAIAPAVGYAVRGVRVGLGTDNTRADAFRNLDAAEQCQRIAHGMPILDVPCGAGWIWVDAATRGAADVCGLGDAVGCLESGQAADFLVLDMMRPETIPSWDFEWELVRYYNRDQIDAAVVNGNVVLAGGRAVAWDDRAFVQAYAGLAAAIGSDSAIVRTHGPSTRYRPS